MAMAKNDRLFIAASIVYLIGLILFFFVRPPLLTLLKNKPSYAITSTTSGEAPDKSILPVSTIRWCLPLSPIKGMEQLERVILERTNEIRKDANLKPFKFDAKLREIALAQGKDMADRDYFTPESPEGISLLERVGTADRKIIGPVGENLFKISGLRDPFDETRVAEDEVMTGLKNNPKQRINIFDPEYTHIGIGSHFHKDTVYVTEIFATVYAYLDEEMPLKIYNGQILSYHGRLMHGLDTSQITLMLRDVCDNHNTIRLESQWVGNDQFQGEFLIKAAKGMYSFGLAYGQRFITGPFIMVE